MPATHMTVGDTGSGAEEYLAVACEARLRGMIPEAAGYLTKSLRIAPRHVGALTEKLLFSLETNSDIDAIETLRAICEIRGDDTSKVIAMAATTLFNRAHAPTYVSIASPNNLSVPLWRIFSAERSPENPDPIVLSDSTTFPVKSESLEVVFINSDLSGLAPGAVPRVISEARRMLHVSGFLVIKLPINANQNYSVEARLSEEVLLASGFTIISNDIVTIDRRFPFIPTLMDNQEQHRYLIGISI